MRSKLFLGLFLAGVSAAAASVGCGGDTGPGGGGGTGGTSSSSSSSSGTTSSSSSSSSSGTTSSSSSSSSSSGSVLPDGCGDTLATAIELMSDDGGALCQLPDPTADQRYFKFSGNKGDIVIIQTDAKPSADEFDTTYLDLVLTLVDDKDNQIAQNDDPPIRFTNDSQIWTVLPSTGTFYLRVEECSKVFGTAVCSPADQITTFDFAVGYTVVAKDPTENPDFTFEGTAANDTAATAQVSTYATNPNGGYYATRIVGDFSSATDVDVYSFDVPADYADPATTTDYPTATFMPIMWGTEGWGSTAPLGSLKLVDSADLTHSVALLDLANAGDPAGLDIAAPITLGHKYYLFVQRPAGATAGANDFYMVWTYDGRGNPLEQNETGNNAAAGAEALTDAMNPAFLAQYFVEGKLDTGDIDHFKFVVPTGAKSLAVSCGAQRSGSGVRGLTWTVVGVNGATATEAVGTDAFKNGIDVSGVAANTELTIRIDSAMAPDANVTSRFYRCGIAFSDQ